jgi:hypothetical protein
VDDSFTFERDGRTYRCRSESGGVASVPVGGVARIDNAAWYVEVDGREYCTVDASLDDFKTPENKHDLEQRITESIHAQGG